MKNQYKLLKKEGYIRGAVVTGIGKNCYGNTCLEMDISTPAAPGTYGITIDGVAKKKGQSQNMRRRHGTYKTRCYKDSTGDYRKIDLQHNKLWEELVEAVKQGKLVEIFYKIRGELYFNEELQEEVWRLDGPLEAFEKKEKKLFEVTEYK